MRGLWLPRSRGRNAFRRRAGTDLAVRARSPLVELQPACQRALSASKIFAKKHLRRFWFRAAVQMLPWTRPASVPFWQALAAAHHPARTGLAPSKHIAGNDRKPSSEKGLLCNEGGLSVIGNAAPGQSASDWGNWLMDGRCGTSSRQLGRTARANGPIEFQSIPVTARPWCSGCRRCGGRQRWPCGGRALRP